MMNIYISELPKKYPNVSVTFFDANAFLQPVSEASTPLLGSDPPS